MVRSQERRETIRDSIRALLLLWELKDSGGGGREEGRELAVGRTVFYPGRHDEITGKRKRC